VQSTYKGPPFSSILHKAALSYVRTGERRGASYIRN
jgi:hypothetical protein